MKEKAKRTAGPATQPICAIAHASDNTPEPITAVMIWALAVIHVPSNTIIKLQVIIELQPNHIYC